MFFSSLSHEEDKAKTSSQVFLVVEAEIFYKQCLII